MGRAIIKSKFFAGTDIRADARTRRSPIIARSILLSMLAIFGSIMFVVLHSPTRFTVPMQTDFAQDYVMGRAILAGQDPYTPLDILTRRFGLGFDLWQHPCPHPPPFALLMAPLALLSYGAAMFMWLLLSEMGLLLSLRLLFNLKWLSVPIWFLISLVWYPIHDDFAMGQLMTVMLALLVVSWVSCRSGHHIRAGVFIGLALCVKLFLWPLIVYFLIKRNFRAAISATGVFIGANIIAGFVIGFDRILYYFLHVGGIVASIYRGNPLNYSVLSLGPRLFIGTKSTFAGRIESSPLLFVPELATPISMLCGIVVLVVVFYFVIRCRNDEYSFAAVICLSIILSPTAWWFYFVILLIPIIAAARMRLTGANIAIGGCLVALYIPRIMPLVFGDRVSFWIGLLLLSPLLAVSLLIVALLAHSNNSRLNEEAAS